MNAYRSLVSFAAIGCLSFAMVAPTQADNVIVGTSYSYYLGGSQLASCCTPGGNPPVPEAAFLDGTFGSGVLNDGRYGDNSYLGTGSIRNDGWLDTGAAYQIGGVGPTAADNPPGIYVNGDFTIRFDLGQNYSNLSRVRIQTGTGGGVGTASEIQIDDDSDPLTDANVISNAFLGETDQGVNNIGVYYTHDIDLSGAGLSGRFLDVTFLGVQNDHIGLHEVQFFAIPEPTSAILMAITGAALIGYGRRRSRNR